MAVLLVFLLSLRRGYWNSPFDAGSLLVLTG